MTRERLLAPSPGFFANLCDKPIIGLFCIGLLMSTNFLYSRLGVPVIPIIAAFPTLIFSLARFSCVASLFPPLSPSFLRFSSCVFLSFERSILPRFLLGTPIWLEYLSSTVKLVLLFLLISTCGWLKRSLGELLTACFAYLMRNSFSNISVSFAFSSLGTGIFTASSYGLCKSTPYIVLMATDPLPPSLLSRFAFSMMRFVWSVLCIKSERSCMCCIETPPSCGLILGSVPVRYSPLL